MLTLKYFLILILSIGLIININGWRIEMLRQEMEGQTNRISLICFLRNSAIMLAMHIYYCSLLLKPIIWWKLLIVWFILLQLFGWLAGGMKGWGKGLGKWGIIMDLGAALVAVWIIEQFVI